MLIKLSVILIFSNILSYWKFPSLAVYSCEMSYRKEYILQNVEFWILVCYAKVHKTRIYFDSFGRKTPLEIQMYMKTAEEFRNNTPVIETSTDIFQRVDTSICGYLWLYVLTSLMRERLPYQNVMDQLNYAFAEHFYW